MTETLPGYSTPQEVIERQRRALFDARAIVVVSRIELEEYGLIARIIDMLRDAERTLSSGLGER